MSKLDDYLASTAAVDGLWLREQESIANVADLRVKFGGDPIAVTARWLYELTIARRRLFGPVRK